MEVVRDRLLTPFGLRSLSPDHPDYKGNYHGDLYSRDAAYHQEQCGLGSSVHLLTPGSRFIRKTDEGHVVSCRALSLGTCTRLAWAQSARYSMRRHPSRLEAVLLKPGRSGGPTVLVSQLITGVRPSQPNITSMTSPESSFMKRNPAFPDSSTNGG
jgi:Amylo-alpha-1,6-glucosidase